MAILITSDGTETEFALEGQGRALLKQLQEAVGGYVEIVARGADGRELLMNEEGAFNASYSVNQRARELTAELLGCPVADIIFLVGPAVLLSSDEVRRFSAPYED